MHLAIELNKKYSKAFMKRARAYELLNKKEECLRGDVHFKGVEQGALLHKLCSFSFSFKRPLRIPRGVAMGATKAKIFKHKYGA